MDYFNIDDTNLESTSYTAGDFDAYLSLGQTSTTEETNEIFAGDWDVSVQPDDEVGLQRILEAEASFGKYDCSLPYGRRLTRGPSDTVTSTTPYDTQTHSNGALSFPGYYCEGVQPDNEVGWSRSLGAEASFGKHNRILPDDGRLTGVLRYSDSDHPIRHPSPQRRGAVTP